MNPNEFYYYVACICAGGLIVSLFEIRSVKREIKGYMHFRARLSLIEYLRFVYLVAAVLLVLCAFACYSVYQINN